MKKYFFYIALAMFLMFSCKSRKAAETPEPIYIEKTIVEKQTLRDTIIVSKADSTFYNALIECENGKPFIRNSQLKDGKNLESSVQLNGNTISFKTYKKQEDIPITILDKIRTETIPKIVYKNKPYPVEKPFSFWQKVQIWAGRIFLSLLVLGSVLFVMKRRIF